MRHVIRRGGLGASVAVSTAILGAAAAGCGGSEDETSLSAEQEAFESPYCDTARRWAVHELEGDGDPPPRAQKAQDATHAYDSRVCGDGGSPDPAAVSFEKTEASKADCEAVAAQKKGRDGSAQAGLTPESFRAFVTSEQFLDALDAQDATAPTEIADDVKTDTEWIRTRKLPLLEDYDYRRLVLEGSAEELAAFNYFDPAVEEQDSRISAYVQQVCGIA